MTKRIFFIVVFVLCYISLCAKTNSSYDFSILSVEAKNTELVKATNQRDIKKIIELCHAGAKFERQAFLEDVDSRDYLYLSDLKKLKNDYLSYSVFGEGILWMPEEFWSLQALKGLDKLDYIEAVAVSKSLAANEAYEKRGDIEMAQHLYIEAMQLYTDICGQESENVAWLWLDYGEFLYYTDRYKFAESALLTGLDVATFIDDTIASKIMLALSRVYRADNNFYKAMDCLEMLKDKVNSIFTKDSEQYVYYLIELGYAAQQFGNNRDAHYYYLQGVDLSKKIFGENNHTYIHALLELSDFYAHCNEYGKCDSILQKVASVCTSFLKYDASNYIYYLGQMGDYYVRKKQFHKAQSSFQQQLQYINKIKYVWDLPYCYSLLADLYYRWGDFDLAYDYYLKAEQAHTLQGEVCYPNLDFLYLLYITQRYDMFEDRLIRWFKQASENILDYFWKNNSNLREWYWSQHWGLFNRMISSYCVDYLAYNPLITRLFYDNILFSKGVLLKTHQDKVAAINDSGDSILIDKQNKLNEINSKIYKLESFSVRNQDTVQINELSQESHALCKEVLLQQNIPRPQTITWDSIRNSLKKNDVAVEFYSFDYYDYGTGFKDTIQYVALVLRPEDTIPVYVPLFEEKEISPFLAGSVNSIYVANGDSLYSKIWSKLTPYISKGKNVYFSPSGLLYQLSIESLPTPSGKLLGEEYNLVRLSSTRELAIHHDSIFGVSANLYGGLTYDVDTTEMLLQHVTYSNSELLSSRALPDDSARAGVRYLPGTQKEVEVISKTLLADGVPSYVYTATAGTEESFKALSGKQNRIIHVATHGFFFAPNEIDKKAMFQQFDALRNPRHNNATLSFVGVDPLLRSGLLLSGANLAYTGHIDQVPENVEDGILTAKEISVLDFSGIELVVLSACETGNGDVTAEGVFGLQRAFKMAGVQSIIMSLWKVDDSATQLFMTEFYTNWIEKKQTKREAFKNAQNVVRSKYEEPEYWAGFIMLD